MPMRTGVGTRPHRPVQMCIGGQISWQQARWLAFLYFTAKLIKRALPVPIDNPYHGWEMPIACTFGYILGGNSGIQNPPQAKHQDGMACGKKGTAKWSHWRSKTFGTPK